MSSGKFPLVPEGDYVVEVDRSEAGLTKDGTRHKVDLFLSIHDQVTKERLGFCWHTITFIPEGEKGHGMWLHANKCLTMPFDGDVVIETDDYVGKSSLAHVIVDEYQGKKRNKIAYFIWPEIDSDNLSAESENAPPTKQIGAGNKKRQPVDDIPDKCPF